MKKFQLKKLLRYKVFGALFLALALGLLAIPGAQAGLIDLGDAGPQNWAVLSVDGAVIFTSSSVTGSPAVANVGVYQGNATFTSSSVAGKLVLQTGHTLNGLAPTVPPSLPQTIAQFAGGVQQDAAGNALLASAAADAISKSNTFFGTAATPGYANLAINNTTHTIDVTGKGLVVASVSSVILTGSNHFNIVGGPTDGLIINLPATIAALNGGFFASGGIDPLNIVLNEHSTGTYSFTSTTIDGIWLSPFAGFELSGSQVGEAIAESVQFHSSSTINNPFTPIPVPPSALLLGSGLLGFGLMGGRKWFRKS